MSQADHGDLEQITAENRADEDCGYVPRPMLKVTKGAWRFHRRRRQEKFLPEIETVGESADPARVAAIPKRVPAGWRVG
jgi:hypothetical protein